MNIVMMTNTYAPHVGGVARSVEAFTGEYRKRGHRVLVVAPEFEGMPDDEQDVVRFPAIQHFSGSDFSVVLPIPRMLESVLTEFKPDIVHSHHPFLIGSTAVRVAHVHEIPLVFTHHTLYEQYTHYVPGDSEAMKRFVIELSTGYANLCDQVLAPSDSVAKIIAQRGVKVPIEIIPTGVQMVRFASDDGRAFRKRMNIPEKAFVIGHLGRLAPEKNLEFMAEVLSGFVKARSDVHVLIAGTGPSEQVIRDIFMQNNCAGQLHMAGILTGDALANAYHAMDVFLFTSKSETQGMVLTEAMAASVPVIGLDAPGVREVVDDYKNGRLLSDESIEVFISALDWIYALNDEELLRLKQHALKTAESFSIRATADKALSVYTKLLENKFVHHQEEYTHWHNILRLIEAEWDILTGVIKATGAAIKKS